MAYWPASFTKIRLERTELTKFGTAFRDWRDVFRCCKQVFVCVFFSLQIIILLITFLEHYKDSHFRMFADTFIILCISLKMRVYLLISFKTLLICDNFVFFFKFYLYTKIFRSFVASLGVDLNLTGTLFKLNHWRAANCSSFFVGRGYIKGNEIYEWLPAHYGEKLLPLHCSVR